MKVGKKIHLFFSNEKLKASKRLRLNLHRKSRLVLFKTALLLCLCMWGNPGSLAADSHPIYIGLNADLSSGSSQSGAAILRGIRIAISEINHTGGVLGRPLQLESMDHRGIPARGRFNIQKFAEEPDIVAVFGGLHTPVIIAEKQKLFDTGKVKLPYLIPWAAGTPITNNPWIFRLSVRDEYAGPFLIRKAIQKGYKRIALLLERTAWGRSNEQSMVAALQRKGLAPTSIHWFVWKTEELRIAQKLETIYQEGSEVVILVANAPEGATIVQAMSKRTKDQRLPVISHWGITGGGFPSRVGEGLQKVDLAFLQTYSFLERPNSEKNLRFLKLASKAYPTRIEQLEDLFSPAGTAHAYDLTHLLALAVRKAGSTERSLIRDALEKIHLHDGLVRRYAPPFKQGIGRNHEALSTTDFKLSRYQYDKRLNRWLIIPETIK